MVVVLSALDVAETRALALRLGVFAFIEKSAPSFGDLASTLEVLHRRFEQTLAGDEVVVPIDGTLGLAVD
jgi:hypothetical protein